MKTNTNTQSHQRTEKRSTFSLFAALCLCVIVLGFGTQSFAQTKPTLETYTNAEHGFKMQYISTWKPQEGDKPWMMVTFVPVDPMIESRAAIGCPKLEDHKEGDPIKLDDIATSLIEVLKVAVPDAKVVVATDSTLGGEKARRMIVTGHSLRTNADMKMLILAAAHNNKPYVVGISATKDEWARAKTGFDQLIETFSFTK